MQRLEVSGAVRHTYMSLSGKGLTTLGGYLVDLLKKRKWTKAIGLTLFFVPCIVMQLCNLSQQMHMF
jgi:hypothetical protein